MTRRLLTFVGAMMAICLAAGTAELATAAAPDLYVAFEASDQPESAWLARTPAGTQAPERAKLLLPAAGRYGGGVRIEADSKNERQARYHRLDYALPANAGDWTVAFWVKFSAAVGPGELFRLDQGLGWEDALVFVSFDKYNQLCLSVWNQARAAQGTIIPGKGGLTTGQWRHLAFTCRQGVRRVYVDGYEINYHRNEPLAGEIPPVKWLRFGGELGMTLDEIKFFARALEPEAIPALMTPPPAPAAAEPAGLFFRAPLDGLADGRGPAGEVTANLAEVKFVPAVIGSGALLMRYGYDRRTALSFGPLPGLFPAELTAGLFLIPNWDGNDGALHGLLAAGAGEARWEFCKTEGGELRYQLQCGGQSVEVKASASGLKNGAPVWLAAGYSQAAGKLFLALDGREVATAPLPQLAFPAGPGRLVVGDLFESDTYRKSQAEGVVDEVRLFARRLEPAELLAEAQRRAVAGTDGERVDLPLVPAGPREIPLWDLAGATRQKTATREKVWLNALWRCQLTEVGQTPQASAWQYLAVPGRYAGHENGYSENVFQFRDRELRKVPFKSGANPWGGKLGHDFRQAWFERTFRLDPAWRSELAGSSVPSKPERRLVLGLDQLGPTASGEIYLNGEKLVDLSNGWRTEIDLDPHKLRGEGENFLLIHVSEGGNRWAWRGIRGDVWLEARPAAQLGRAQVITSVREGRLTLRAEARNLGREARIVRLQCRLTGDRTPAEKLLSEPRSLAPGETAMLEIVQPWADPRLWDLGDPYLYEYQLSLAGEGEQELDELSPARFGFREFWIEGADFVLNGIKLHLRADDHWFGGSSDPEWCRRWVKELKGLGYNSLRGPFKYNDNNYENMLTACDEAGVPFFIDAGGVKGDSFATWNNPATRRQVEADLRGVIEPWINHPSVVMWYLSTNFLGYGVDYHPLKVAEAYEPPFRVAKAQACLEGAQMLNRTDTTRPYFFQAGGVFGPIHTSNGYFGWWPLAEQMEWPEEWSKRRLKPLFMVETSFPYWEDWWGMDLQNGQERPTLLVENTARFLGDEAYGLMGEKEKPFLGSKVNAGDFMLAGHRGLEAVWRVKSELIRQVLPAWRGADISGFIPFAELGYAFPRKNPGPSYHSSLQTSIEPGDFRRLGWHPDAIKWPYQRDCDPDQPLTPAGEALKAALAPVLVYIGGEAARPTARDHVYFVGETVEKSVVVVNDLRTPQHFAWHWSLTDVQAKPVGPAGEEQLDLPAGGVARVKLQFTAPAIKNGAEDLTLRVEVTAPAGVKVEPFSLRVCSPQPVPAVKYNLALHDPRGLTRTALEKREVKFASLEQVSDLQNVRLIVVGREGLDEAFAVQARRLKLAAAVSEGRVNVLIFEQSSLASLGLAMNAPYCREVFAGGGESSLLAGVSAAELSWPRGDGTLAEAYPLPDPTTEDSVKSPFWHWGNRNLAASFLPRRPSAGWSRAHLTAGQDLVYAPLLELGTGRGRVFCCQYELTPRVGIDPAATRLFDNLLVECGQSVASSRPLFAFGRAAEELLNNLGYAFTPLAAPAALDPRGVVVAALSGEEWARDHAAWEAKLQAGATLLVLPLKAEAAAGFGLKAEPIKETLKFDLTAAGQKWLSELSGRDRFFRYGFEAPALQGPDLTAWTSPALINEKSFGAGRMILVQLDPRLYEPARQAAAAKLGRGSSQLMVLTGQQDRAALVWTTLLARLGAAAADDLAGRLEVPLGEQRLDLRGEWQFAVDPDEVGVKEQWFAPEFDAAAWRKITVPGLWENQGVTQVNPHRPSEAKWHKDYDGCAWYRLRAKLPEAMRGQDLVFAAPQGIDDFDWVYVNGVEIGHTGAETPGYWSAPRAYPIPSTLTGGTGELILTVRIFDDKGGGGIVSPTVELRTKSAPRRPLPYYQAELPGYDTECHIRW